MPIEINGSYDGAIAQLQRLKRFESEGERWARHSARKLKSALIRHLERQGRGGEGPPLSPFTREVYSRLGDPDGSGIRNHIQVVDDRHKSRSQYQSTVGIPSGKPEIVARVQEDGATIPVSSRTRRFFAANGIYIRSSTQAFHVPGRHFWSKSCDWVSKESKKDLVRRFQQFTRP